MSPEKLAEVILEENIPNWNCCFNCVFAKKMRMSSYICQVREFLYKDDPNFKKLRKVDKSDCCEDLITRPKFGAETFGYAVILYHPRRAGVKKFEFNEAMIDYYNEKIERVKTKYNIPHLTPSLGFGWSWTSIKYYPLQRNRIIYGLDNQKGRYKYKCTECQRLSYDVEIHHIVERHKGGSDTTANLRILCLYCHSLETWKLMTGKTDVSNWVKWKKAIEIKKRLWEEKWKFSDFYFDLEYYKRGIEHLNSFTPERIKELEESGRLKVSAKEFIQAIKEKKREITEKIENINTKSARIQKRLSFWREQYKITDKWDSTMEEFENRLKIPNKLISL